jgi:tetratricopeptide (TPR) repeat protein
MSNFSDRELSYEFREKLAKYSSYDIQRGLSLAQRLQPLFMSNQSNIKLPDKENENFRSAEVQTLFDLGVENFQLGNNQSAINCFSQALQIAPTHVGSLCLRGFSYDYLGDGERASRDLESVLEVDREDKPIYLLYAQAIGYSLLNNSPKATPKFAEILHRQPESQDKYASVNWFLRASTHYFHGNKLEALRDLNQSLNLNPKSFVSLFLRGSIHIQLGKLEQGIEDVSSALEINPYSEKIPLILHLRGLAHYTFKKYHSAIEDLTRALEMNPHHEENINSFYFRGLSYLALGKCEKSIDDLTQALTINSDHKENALKFHFRGIAYLDLLDYQKSIENFTKAIMLDPYHEQAALNFYFRGLANFQSEKFTEAIGDLTQALEIDPNHEQSAFNFYYRGLCYQQIGENDKAIEDLTRVTEIDPDFYSRF